MVLIRATQYHMQVVETWEPRITGPMTTGSRLESCSREEEQMFGVATARCPGQEACRLKEPTHHVLQRMGIGGHHPDGSGPLVVLLVETFIEVWVVEQPERDDRGEMFVTVK